MKNNQNIYKKIGSNLRKIRLQKGLLQIDVAVAAELNRTYVSRMETGKARISYLMLLKVTKALEATSQEVLGGVIHD